MKLNDILKQPTTSKEIGDVGNITIHESIFRSYHVSKYIISMTQRGDSKETILDVFNLLNETQLEMDEIFNISNT